MVKLRAQNNPVKKNYDMCEIIIKHELCMGSTCRRIFGRREPIEIKKSVYSQDSPVLLF